MMVLEKGLRDTLDSIYTHKWQRLYCAAEIAYFEMYNNLPEWGCFIDRIERDGNGNLIIAHRGDDHDD